jgi:hypothetical protein
MSNWIDIKKQHPPVGEKVLVHVVCQDKKDMVVMSTFSFLNGEYTEWDDIIFYFSDIPHEITHWQYLPEFPI